MTDRFCCCFFVFVVLLGLTKGFGREVFNCNGQLETSLSSGNGGFNLFVEGSPQFYRSEKVYTVTLSGDRSVSFRGFHISARSLNEDEDAGTFQPHNQFTSKLQENCGNEAMIETHHGKKSNVRVLWRAPTSNLACVLLQASVKGKGNRWYRNDESLSVKLCPSDEEISESCCSCGSATYRMKFYGIWSSETHPKDYPKYSTHWSNVVGGSHSPLYTMWKFGQLSSASIQQVAEWGYPEKLLKELAALKGEDVLSVIKTRAQWPAYPLNGKFKPLTATFSTDSTRFLVSLVTMLGPSPDWNVGLTKESMCLSSCGWVGEREYFLTPWDAGTDDGITYNSPNAPSNPHKPIQLINSTDHEGSPFYSETGAPIPPLARITIERVQLSGEQCGESEEVENKEADDVEDSVDDVGDFPACMYSDWLEWLPCSVSCGWGLKNRNRMLKVGKVMTCTDMIQTEICQGSNTCANNNNVTTCLYSEWTSWSSCSASCGEAVRARQRVMKWPSEPTSCTAPLKEMVQCQLPSCSDACIYTAWLPWMRCSAECGPGYTFRKRGLVAGSVEMCNVVMQNSSCMTSFDCLAEQEVVTSCEYSPWTEWMDCPVSCGAGLTLRKRMLTSGDSRCEAIEMQRSKCMTSSSCEESEDEDDSTRCRWSLWSTWTGCSVTCGVGVSMRRRISFDYDLTSTNCHDDEVEKITCTRDVCLQCFYSPWGDWEPCSASCGQGITTRKRLLDTSQASEANCPPFQMEVNRCLLPCDDVINANCTLGKWGPWTDCSESCGHSAMRSRTRSNPDYPGCEERITKRCKSSRCPQDCVMGEWNEWRVCWKSMTNRKRKVLKRARFGGEACGARREVKSC